mgnify:FL=1
MQASESFVAKRFSRSSRSSSAASLYASCQESRRTDNEQRAPYALATRRLAFFFPRLAALTPAQRELAIPFEPQPGARLEARTARSMQARDMHVRRSRPRRRASGRVGSRTRFRRPKGCEAGESPEGCRSKGARSGRTRYSCVHAGQCIGRTVGCTTAEIADCASLPKTRHRKLTHCPPPIRSRTLKPWRSTHRVPAPLPPLRHLSCVTLPDLSENESPSDQTRATRRPARLRPTTTPTRTRPFESTRRCSRTRSGH